jgi:SAM-dependent methyltransferase
VRDNLTNKTLREAEASSIQHFIENNVGLLVGDVLDYGCGKQPYRDIIVAAGGVYHGYDRPGYAGSTVKVKVGEDWPLGRKRFWGAILCNQVIQYLSDPRQILCSFYDALGPGGWLVMTGPTNWPEVEPVDTWRFTTEGIGRLVDVTGFHQVTAVSREQMRINDIVLSLGWGVVGQRPPVKKAKR